MIKKHTRLPALILTIVNLTFSAVAIFAQGTLEPPSSTPEPTQKSLQEIWDKVEGLESKVGDLENEVEALSSQNNDLTNLLLSVAQEMGTIRWRFDTIGNGISGSRASLAFSPSGHSAISFYDETEETLNYAIFDGSALNTEVVDSSGDVGEHNSLAFSPSGQPAISYFDATRGYLKYASFDGTSWEIETVDSDEIVGLYTSLAFYPSGRPAISYYDATNDDLKYATFADSEWKTFTIDSNGDVGLYTSLAISPSEVPAISYYDRDKGDLKFITIRGVWIPTIVESEGDTGQFSSLAFSPSGQPAISYIKDGVGLPELKYAIKEKVGLSWNTFSVDSDGDVRGHTSLVFSPSGRAAIGYYEDTSLGGLKFATQTLNRGWRTETLAFVGFNRGIALKFTPSGQPAISYYTTGGSLWYIERVPFAEP